MANDPNNPNEQISLQALIATLIDNNINYISPARLRSVLLGMAERITPPAGGNGLSVESPLEYDPFSGMLSIPAADPATDGYLTKEDYNEFKAGMVSAVQTVTGDTVDNTDPQNPVVNAASESYVNSRADQARDEAIADADTKLASKADLVSGTVPSSQLPSYVDDVLNYANLAAFPATGETGKIYIANDTNKQYRWTGSAYIQITNGLIGSTSDVPEGLNLYFTDARVRAVLLAGLSLLTGGSITSSDSVLQAFGKLQNQISNLKTVDGNSLTGPGNIPVSRKFSVALNRAISVTNPTWYIATAITATTINTDSGTNNLITALSAAVYGNQVCGAPYNCKLTHIVYTGRGASATIFGVVKGTITSTGTLSPVATVFEDTVFTANRNRVVTVAPSVTINAGEVIRFAMRQDVTSAASDQATITFFFEEVI